MLTEPPPPIPVGQEPPPMHRLNGTPPPARQRGHQNKAKGKAAGRKPGDRFAVVNSFLDFTARAVSRRDADVASALAGYQAGRHRGLRKRT